MEGKLETVNPRQLLSSHRTGALLCLILGLGIGLAWRELPVTSSSLAQQTGSLAQQAGSPALTASPSGPSPLTSSRTSLSALQAAPAAETLLTPEEAINTSVYATCNRSVVHIATKATRMDTFLLTAVREGTGSGSIIDQLGHILTNHHVIEGAKEITVSLYNGLTYPAMLVGQDPETDIAVLKIDAPPSELVPIAWGDSQSLRVGQRIFAIGNPFGLERTMSTGIISSLNRQIPSSHNRTMRSLIQIDAALNQGNSGGPLINTRSELIGMNTAIMSTHGDSAGVGFAIPVSTLKRIVPSLIQEGRIVRPTIGIARVYENNGGLMIVSLVPGGPAEKAGLQGFSLAKKSFRQGPFRYEQTVVDPKTADMIKAADGEPVKNADDLLAIIERKRPGETVELVIERGGQKLTARILLGPGN
jgi:S1-C subfamily serine protease